jgi:hypothetical protein
VTEHGRTRARKARDEDDLLHRPRSYSAALNERTTR